MKYKILESIELATYYAKFHFLTIDFNVNRSSSIKIVSKHENAEMTGISNSSSGLTPQTKVWAGHVGTSAVHWRPPLHAVHTRQDQYQCF